MTDKKKSDYKKILKKCKEKYWAISTITLAILLVFVLITGTTSSTTIGKTEAGQKVLEFANNQGANAELISTTDSGQLYEVILSINGNEVPVYITKDGENLIPSLIPMALAPEQNTPQQPTQTEIPKSDKPEVELYIWSYCPYGVAAQGPLAQVSSILRNSANIKTIMYHDGHGEYETQQNKIQACMQELGEEKYWDYAEKFVEIIYPKCSASRDVTCNLEESTNLMNSLGMDSSKILECVDDQGAALIQRDSEKAKAIGVTGSPTLIINGVKADVARTEEAFKTAICSAFNEMPDECSETLDSTQVAAQGSC